MTITWQTLHPSRHSWFVLESEPYRLQRSASDLNGTDPNIHNGYARASFANSAISSGVAECRLYRE